MASRGRRDALRFPALRGLKVVQPQAIIDRFVMRFFTPMKTPIQMGQVAPHLLECNMLTLLLTQPF